MKSIEKRTHRRYCAGFEGKLIHKSVDYHAFIGNVSNSGIYIVALVGEAARGITPKTPLTVEIYLPKDDVISLNCRKVWSHKTILSHTSSRRMGMKIMNPPSKYIQFVNTLARSYKYLLFKTYDLLPSISVFYHKEKFSDSHTVIKDRSIVICITTPLK